MPYREFMQWGVFFDLENRNYCQTDINIAQILHIASKGKIKMRDALPSEFKVEQTKDQCIGNLALLRNAMKRNR
jgi:hypothetical protein